MATKYNIGETESPVLCETIEQYCHSNATRMAQRSIFIPHTQPSRKGDIRVIELFAGVGGFRIGLERASSRYKTVWNNQWEPSTKRQDASAIYCSNFGSEGHSNEDIATVPINEIPEADLLCGGFPCQDYSVATTLKNAGGIEGKKGVLWWQIYRILSTIAKKPTFLILENVDRLLKSPASQRGRDFAIILASLSDLGYDVEWRVINAADYGMPQRRCRTYMVGYLRNSVFKRDTNDDSEWLLSNGIMAHAFECHKRTGEKEKSNQFLIEGDLHSISQSFNVGKKASPFLNAGFMTNRSVYTTDVDADYTGVRILLKDILVEEASVPEEFFINDNDIPSWKSQKGGKSETRISSTGFEYHYSEGAMAFPDPIDRPSRTIITGEGGASASRFKHVITTPSGRYRRLIPVELERLNMFPDNHTKGASDTRRAFLMGNALVTGIVERIGIELLKYT